MSAVVLYKGRFVDVYTVDDKAVDDMYHELWMEEEGEALHSIEAKTRREFVCKYLERYQDKWQLSFFFWEVS